MLATTYIGSARGRSFCGCSRYDRDTRNQRTIGANSVAFLDLTTLGSTLTRLINFWASLKVSLGAIYRIEAFEQSTPPELGDSKRRTRFT